MNVLISLVYQKVIHDGRNWNGTPEVWTTVKGYTIQCMHFHGKASHGVSHRRICHVFFFLVERFMDKQPGGKVNRTTALRPASA